MEQSDLEFIAKKIVYHLEENRHITSDEHDMQHACLARWIIRENKRDAFHDAVKRQVYGWGIVVVLSGIGTAVYNAALYILNNRPGH